MSYFDLDYNYYNYENESVKDKNLFDGIYFEEEKIEEKIVEEEKEKEIKLDELIKKQIDFLLDDKEIKIQKKNKKNKKKKKKCKLTNYNIRKGDWLCNKCHNINFHFRTICNVCKANKI